MQVITKTPVTYNYKCINHGCIGIDLRHLHVIALHDKVYGYINAYISIESDG